MIPLGCEPQLLTLYRGSVDAAGYDPQSGCITRLNGLAELHNRELRRVLGGLRRAHPGTAIVYADLYRAVTDIIVSPREYGAHARTHTTDSCSVVPHRFLISMLVPDRFLH
jgi:phospholipase/lecithinase/hemolysin